MLETFPSNIVQPERWSVTFLWSPSKANYFWSFVILLWTFLLNHHHEPHFASQECVGNRRLVPCLFFMFLCWCICDLFGHMRGIYFDCLVNNCDWLWMELQWMWMECEWLVIWLFMPKEDVLGYKPQRLIYVLFVKWDAHWSVMPFTSKLDGSLKKIPFGENYVNETLFSLL